VDEQKKRISEYVTAKLPEHEFMGFTVDNGLLIKTTRQARTGEGRVFFLEQPQAAALNVRMQSGDHIVIAKLSRAFLNLDDFFATRELWQTRRIIVHVLDLPNGLDGWRTVSGQLLLHAIAQWDRERRKELTYTPGCGGNMAGFGFRYIRQGRGRERLVPNYREQEWLNHIMFMRDKDNLDWVQIAERINSWGAYWCDRQGRRRAWTGRRVQKGYCAWKARLSQPLSPALISPVSSSPLLVEPHNILSDQSAHPDQTPTVEDH